jgi:hypothetical protein
MRLALAPKAVEVAEEEVEDKVVDVVSIKHDSDKKPDNARWFIIMNRWYR